MIGNGRPIASVVALSYNDRQNLEGCLCSLIDQDLPAEEYEIICIGSPGIVYRRSDQPPGSLLPGETGALVK